jgi:hypothetical protein
MRTELGVGVALLVLASGCVTTTAHRLQLAGNPLAAQAESCELACRARLPPAPANPCRKFVGEPEDCRTPVVVDRTEYARCLDGCPGATAIDGASCPDKPQPGVVCAETSKANAGGIAGGVVATVAIVLAIAAIALLGAFVDAVTHPPGIPN